MEKGKQSSGKLVPYPHLELTLGRANGRESTLGDPVSVQGVLTEAEGDLRVLGCGPASSSQLPTSSASGFCTGTLGPSRHCRAPFWQPIAQLSDPTCLVGQTPGCSVSLLQNPT